MARDTDDVLTGTELWAYMAIAAEGEIDASSGDVEEKIIDAIEAEGIQKVDVNLGGGSVTAYTRTLRLWGRLDCEDGRIITSQVELREGGNLLGEDMPGELLGGFREIREGIEDELERRRNHIPPKKYP